MTRTELIAALKEAGIPFEVYEHPAVFTVEEVEKLNLPRPESGAKNLFLRDDKKRNYYLLTARDPVRVDLKGFQQSIGARKLSFASEEDLFAFLGLTRGSVTTFGALNDTGHRVSVYLDDWFRDREIALHPMENTASLYLQANDLVAFLEKNGHPVEWVNLP